MENSALPATKPDREALMQGVREEHPARNPKPKPCSQSQNLPVCSLQLHTSDSKPASVAAEVLGTFKTLPSLKLNEQKYLTVGSTDNEPANVATFISYCRSDSAGLFNFAVQPGLV